MAHTARVKLDSAGAGSSDCLRVNVRVDICLHNRQGHIVAQSLDRTRERRGLARTRARHQIEQKRPLSTQTLTKPIGMGVVIRKHALLDFQHSYVFHVSSLLYLPNKAGIA